MGFGIAFCPNICAYPDGAKFGEFCCGLSVCTEIGGGGGGGGGAVPGGGLGKYPPPGAIVGKPLASPAELVFQLGE